VPVRIDVSPPLLSSGAARQQLAAERVANIATSLGSAGEGAVAAAGDPGVVGTLGTASGEGAGALRGLSATVAGLSANLEAAAGAYVNADTSSIGGGRG
jgi:precorrin-2 methylase